MKTIKFTTTSLIFLFFISTIQAQGTKEIKLIHDGTYWGQVIVTWVERGVKKQYDSGRGIGNDYEYTLSISEYATNIKATVHTNRGFGVYGEGCSKNLGTSGGTFTFGGPIYSESCNWVPNEVGAENTIVDANYNINEIMSGGNSRLHLAVKSGSYIDTRNLIAKGITHVNTPNTRGFTPLHEATQLKNGELIDLLLQNGANYMALNTQQQTPLFMAVNLGEKDLAQKFIEAGHSMSNAQKEIERAIMKSDIEMVRLFLDNNADPNLVTDLALQKNKIDIVEIALDSYNATPSISLYKKAVDARKMDLAESLIQKDIDPNLAMDHAITKKANDLVMRCLEAGGDANKALGYAVSSKNPNLAMDAIMTYSANPDPHVRNAMSNRSTEIVDILLQGNADKDQALHHAIDLNNSSMIDVCINNGAMPNDAHTKKVASAGKDADLQKLIDAGANAEVALSAAMGAKKYGTAVKMIDAGATPENVVKTAVEQKQLPLLKKALEYQADPAPGLLPAISAKQSEYAKLLLEAGADANTAMPTAIDLNESTLVQLLIDNGADAAQTSFIEKACTNKNSAMVKLLLDAGADASAGLLPAVKVNESNITQLLITAGATVNSSELITTAAGHNNPTLTGLLIDAGANPADALEPCLKVNASKVLEQIIEKGVDASADRYLMETVKNGHLASATVLIKNGADPNYVDPSDNNYLHIAAETEHRQLVPLFAANDVDINAVNASGNTPLHIAIMKGRRADDLVVNLISAGADVNIKNGKGEYPLEFAKGSKIKRALKKAGAID